MFSGVLILRQHFAAYNYAALFFLVLVVMIYHTCSARNLNHRYHRCAPSSCGNIRNISYPFRLKTDPENCGNKKYELVCENNRAVVHLDNTTAKYSVRAIDYDNFTIRVADANVDKDDCPSIPHQYLPSGNDPYQWYYYQFCLLIFVTCANPVSSPLYVDTSSCDGDGTDTSNSSMSSPSHLNAYSYVMVGRGSDPSVSVGDLMDSCHIDVITPFMRWLVANWTSDSYNYKQVHDFMLHGFEISWKEACCESVQENRCNLEPTQFSLYCRAYGRSIDNDPTTAFGQFIDGDPIAAFRRSTDNDPIAELLNGFLRLLEPSRRLNLKFYTVRVERWYLLITFYIGHRVTQWETQSLSLALLIILVGSIGLLHVALFFCGIPCLITLLIYKWRRRHLSMYNMIEEFLQSHDNRLMPVRYSYSEIKKITNGFKDKLGEGGYGSVYKGKLRSGRFAAIKMLSKSKANGQEFMNEVATIGRIHHVNVVQLIGFCAEGSKRALVYEFMPNGSLDKHIFYREGSNIIPLSNEKMYEISLGAARGIEYLHRGCDMQILHFDIKPHNILLDENFNPKVSDFGLAKLYPTEKSIVSLTAARGTLGYMVPELFYKNIGGISYKADVYSFGVLLMEMVGRRKNLNAHAEHSSQIYFPSWVYDQLNEDKDIELGDVTEVGRKTTKKMIIVALWCIQLMPNDRPSMQKVMEMLEAAEVERLQMPPKPFLTPREVPVVKMEDPTRLTSPPDGCIDSSYQFGR